MFPQGKILILTFLIISLIGNIVLFLFWEHDSQMGQHFTILKNKYPFLSQRVLLEDYTNDFINNFLPLRQQLHTMIDPYADSFAIYFEYLPTGTSIGINEDTNFTAASLLKVPVVMAYLYKKESMGLTKDPTVEITAQEVNKKFGTLYKKGAGYQINLKDAVSLALQKSDNTASLVLADNISDSDFEHVYEGLDIPLALKGDSPIISAIQYTSVLKALYFASILNRDDSEAILHMLTRTDFHDMLPHGLPTNLPVAHKIGLIDKQIYSDCGIVYVPNRPYALCMISKSDRTIARERMSAISQVIYTYVAGYKD